MNHISLNERSGLDVMQSHQLHKTRFSQYQVHMGSSSKYLHECIPSVRGGVCVPSLNILWIICPFSSTPPLCHMYTLSLDAMCCVPITKCVTSVGLSVIRAISEHCLLTVSIWVLWNTPYGCFLGTRGRDHLPCG